MAGRGELERARVRGEPDTLSEAVSGLSAGMSALVRGHLDLARIEMTRDLRALGREMGLQLSGAPIVLIGYLLLWLAIGSLLAQKMPLWVAYLLCALANFACGAAMLLWGQAKRKKNRPRLPATTAELRKDRSWIADLRRPSEPERGPVHSSRQSNASPS